MKFEKEIIKKIGKNKYDEMVILQKKKKSLKRELKRVKSKLNKVEKKIKRKCNHLVLYKFGRNQTDIWKGEPYYQKAGLKCDVCGKIWKEYDNTFKEMKKKINNAVIVNGHWDSDENGF